MVFVAILISSIYLAPTYHLKYRVMAMWFVGKESEHGRPMGYAPDLRVPVEYGYPQEPMLLPSWICGVVVLVAPLLVITLFQIRVRSLWDFHAGVTGIFKALLST